ncbi:MAG: hypothetical protein QME12_05660 [Nanoarchaeota archaeon]|nr:hypothetical protein [Nanoarchaeota archaeon]
MEARSFPEKKVKAFLDALVQREHISVSEIQTTGSGDHRIMVLGKQVIIAIKHRGEKGIKEPYIREIINAAAEKYGPVGSPEYSAGRDMLKKLARKTIGF